MLARNRGNTSHVFRVFVLLLAASFLLTLAAGCDTASPTLALPQTPAATFSQQGQINGPLLPTPTPTLQPLTLHGPANFLLRTPLDFSNVSGSATDGNGTTTQLDAKTIKDGINEEFKHLLFMVDSNDSVKVYNPGATTPTTVQITQNNDGSTAIAYTQTTNSEAGSFAITFDGVLSKNRISALYEQRYAPLLISSVSASDVTVAFTAPVRWVAADEIPAAPVSGTYRITSSGGIALSWGAGQRAVAYDVYRLIPARDQQFQLLGTVKDPAYNDNSPEAVQNAHATPAIAYAIFSVGPTGIENPANLVISLEG